MKINASLAQRAALAGLSLGILCALAIVVAGPGHRFGVWHYRVSFTLMKWAAYGGLAAIAVSLGAAAISVRRNVALFPSLVGIALGAFSAWLPWHKLQVAHGVPPIHDISTDTAHPPEFVAVVPLRGEGSNKLDYDPKVAEQQKQAYPDIEPLLLDAPLNEAFRRARVTAGAMGWEIDGEDPAAGRIEATDTTFWFGFKDDIVIRVTAAGKGSRVDVRSVSRVGQSDLGANAARIRKYLAALQGPT